MAPFEPNLFAKKLGIIRKQIGGAGDYAHCVSIAFYKEKPTVPGISLAGENRITPIKNLASWTTRIFTMNCGIYSIQHLRMEIPDSLKKKALDLLEWEIFFRNSCVPTILLGSDKEGGVTHDTILKHGEGWKFGEPIHNRRYAIDLYHKILTFEKRWTDFKGDVNGPAFT